jgi:biopolymer transport protein TolQ
MDAFIRIGAAKTASLPVVAPAIGEALITTAIGLAAAIPAVFFYNWIDKRVGDFVSELEAAAAEWVALVAENQRAGSMDSAIPLVGGVRPR